MAQKTINARISLRADTAANFTSVNPVLLKNELAIEKDTGKKKLGDGTSKYSALPYLEKTEWSEIENIPSSFNPAEHTHNYAGSSSAGGAAISANKINSDAGSATQPVYFKNGIPIKTTYTLNANVPADAKFTDTTYTHPSTHAASMITGLADVATSGAYADLTGAPESLPADGGDADTVNGFTVGTNVPANAKFTDTTYSTGTTTVSGLTKLYTSTGANTDGTITQSAITTALNEKSDSDHTHNYAGSSSAGGAASSADKINTDAGSVTQPVYFANGIPVKTTYTLGASVPSGAKFTDTVYTHPSTHAASMITGLADVATSGAYADLTGTPTALPADGGDADTVSGFTVGVSVPADAKFTDTVYTLPNATSSTLGGVKAGTNISVSSGTISVANGSTSTKGVVQLTNSTSSTSTTTAATPASVKSAYDLANSKQSPSTTLAGYGITDAYTKTEVDSAVSVKANTSDLADVATSGAYADLSGTPTSLKNPTALTVQNSAGTSLGSYDGSAAKTIKLTASIVGLGNVTNESKATMFASAALTGTPTAPTASATTNSTQIATTAFVNTVVNNKIAAADAMIYKGTIGTSGTVTALPDTHSTGWTYKVITAGTYAGVACNVGDMIICLTDGTAANNAHWTVVEGNIDGAVTGPASAVNARIAVFDGTTGKVIKDSGYTIATSVPSGAKFTDTTYTLGSFGITATAYELNVLDGITATVTELNYTDGVTSNIQTQLNAKAALASPTFTGTPKAPTAAAGTNTTQVATTAFVTTAVANKTSVSGNAGTATKLANSRSIILSGDTTASGEFDGSENLSLTTTLVNSGVTAGSYGQSADASPAHKGTFSVPYITVDAKGRVTAASTKTITLPADNNTTYSAMTGATSSAAGTTGLVPAPAAGKQTSFLRGDGTWVVPTNTTYSAATTSASGLMSATDKSKLDGIDAGANAYTHPSYTARTGKPTGNQTPAFGGTATVSQITSDATGHVTGATDRTITIPSTLSNGTSTAGLIKTTSTVTSNSGYTACPVISGVPYYKDTNTTYTLSSFGVTATAAELNALDGITATVTELNYCDGVTSNIQTQLDGKSEAGHAHSDYVALTTTQEISGIKTFSGNNKFISDQYVAAGTSFKWYQNNQSTIVGTLNQSSYSGNAASATKATQDGSGNIIVDTYATKTDTYTKQEVEDIIASLQEQLNNAITDLTVEGNVITFTKGNGTTGSITVDSIYG